MRVAIGLTIGSAAIGGAGALDPDAQTFIDRVLADGGTVEDTAFLNSFVLDAKANNYWTDIVAAYSPSWGVKGGATASDLYAVTGAAFDLAQAVAASQLTININDLKGKTRIFADGINDSIQSSAFTYNQPETMVYGGFEQESWATGDRISDGLGAGNAQVVQSGVSPDLNIRAGVTSPSDNGAAIGVPVNFRALFNGVSSEIQIDNNAKTTGSAGASSASGFTYGSNDGMTSFGNTSVGMIVLLDSVVDANYDAKMTAIYNFSKSAYGTA